MQYFSVLLYLSLRLMQGYRIQPHVVPEVEFLTSRIQPTSWYFSAVGRKNQPVDASKLPFQVVIDVGCDYIDSFEIRKGTLKQPFPTFANHYSFNFSNFSSEKWNILPNTFIKIARRSLVVILLVAFTATTIMLWMCPDTPFLLLIPWQLARKWILGHCSSW